MVRIPALGNTELAPEVSPDGRYLAFAMQLWSYASALTPIEALTIATKHAAYFVGLDRYVGSLLAGKFADLVVLNADPLRDIRNTMDIAYVMKGGVLYEDEELKVVWGKAGDGR